LWYMQPRNIPQTKEGVCSLMWRQSSRVFMFYVELNIMLRRNISASVCELMPAANLSNFYGSH
jgi:hypothetical protein